ncbi:MAG TPA: hypothetical protein VFO58_12425 [Vicinamibacterales bacterium]|nr:hypothetical protein [Vicinamibacterales bacterium]
MKEKGLVVFNVLTGSAVIAVFFFSYSRHLQAPAFAWVLLYLLGVGLPTLWSYRMARALCALNVSLPSELQWAPYYPVLAVVITLIGVLGLIREAVLFR